MTKFDIKNIRELFQEILREILDLEPGQTFDDKLSYLPSKEEFYKKEDEVLKELKTVREEMQILNDLHGKVNHHERRIEKVEKHLHLQAAL